MPRWTMTTFLVVLVTVSGCAIDVGGVRPPVPVSKQDIKSIRYACAATFGSHIATEIASTRRKRRYVTLGISIVATTITTLLSVRDALKTPEERMMSNPGVTTAVASGIAGASSLSELVVSVLEKDFSQLNTDSAAMRTYVRSGGAEPTASYDATVRVIANEIPDIEDEIEKCVRDLSK